MEKTSSHLLNRREGGSALIVVLLALLVLLPLALTLLTMVAARLKQVVDFRERIQQEAAARGGFEEAAARVAGRAVRLAPGETFSYILGGLEGLEPRIRLVREPDTILSLSGQALAPGERYSLHLDAYDGEGRRVYAYRKLEVYLVEVIVRSRPELGAVRLRGVLARKPDDSLVSLGVQVKRGFFGP